MTVVDDFNDLIFQKTSKKDHDLAAVPFVFV